MTLGETLERAIAVRSGPAQDGVKIGLRAVVLIVYGGFAIVAAWAGNPWTAVWFMSLLVGFCAASGWTTAHFAAKNRTADRDYITTLTRHIQWQDGIIEQQADLIGRLTRLTPGDEWKS